MVSLGLPSAASVGAVEEEVAEEVSQAKEEVAVVVGEALLSEVEEEAGLPLIQLDRNQK